MVFWSHPCSWEAVSFVSDLDFRTREVWAAAVDSDASSAFRVGILVRVPNLAVPLDSSPFAIVAGEISYKKLLSDTLI